MERRELLLFVCVGLLFLSTLVLSIAYYRMNADMVAQERWITVNRELERYCPASLSDLTGWSAPPTALLRENHAPTYIVVTNLLSHSINITFDAEFPEGADVILRYVPSDDPLPPNQTRSYYLEYVAPGITRDRTQGTLTVYADGVPYRNQTVYLLRYDQ